MSSNFIAESKIEKRKLRNARYVSIIFWYDKINNISIIKIQRKKEKIANMTQEQQQEIKKLTNLARTKKRQEKMVININYY
jgi:hypothetical protein